MSTDLHAALREAVAYAPYDDADLRTVVDAGSRRVRRRAALGVGASALVTAAVVLTSVLVASPDPSEEEPPPAEVVRLELDRADERRVDVVASVRTTWREPMNSLDHDRFEGLTTDGLALRSRYTDEGDVHELGLLDPETGSTDWLPPPPVDPAAVVELTADRLVLLGEMNPSRSALLVFDRQSRSWNSSTVELPPGLEVHAPFRLAIGSDDRLYLGSTFEGESGPLSWWSYAVPEGGEARPEPELAGAAVAWAAGERATVDSDGQLVLSSSGSERILAEQRPPGCEPPSDPDLADIPPAVGLAGNRAVVTYWCGDEGQPVTLVHATDGRDALQVTGAVFHAADEDQVLLVAPRGGPGGVYLLDLDRLTLARIGAALHEEQVGLAEGLVLWNEPGSLDDRDVYDVVWKVARSS